MVDMLTSDIKVLVTGAAGLVGGILRKGCSGRYGLLRLSDIADLGVAGPGEELVRADLTIPDEMEAAMCGIDCVVHLGGYAGEADWNLIHPINVGGTLNVFEAARKQGVKRVVFASSNHAVGYHRRARIIDTEVMVRPDGPYGVAKAFGEALGRMYADKYGMSVSCMRIGTVRDPDRPTEARQLHTWLSHRDATHLTQRCIEAPYHFCVVYGVSNNTRNLWDNSKVAYLGYSPQDNSEEFASQILTRGDAEDLVAKLFHGGFYTPMNFSGDVDQID
ncbi:NAD-dependent epimerase/dehydratase family protein [Variovorax boronicumulans]